MKKILLLLLLGAASTSAFKLVPKKTNTAELPVYTGHDLGVTYAPARTLFKVWSPQATAVKLRLYKAGDGGEAVRTADLAKGKAGTWELTVRQNLKNLYYTFQTQIDGKWLLECPDMYAKALGVNGKRGMIIDMAATNPTGWAADKRPAQKHLTDIILYETHIRDISEALIRAYAIKANF